jgi:hypothetical protein
LVGLFRRRSVRRKADTYTEEQKTEKDFFRPRMEFEPMIPAFERVKTFRALDARSLRSAHVLVIGIIFFPLTLQKTVPGMHYYALLKYLIEIKASKIKRVTWII